MSEWALKRFWKEVRVDSDDSGFVIRLDDRPVRTPAKRSLTVPTDAIATRIAAEWDAQTEKVDPTGMPWTRSANAAIDKVALQSAEVKTHLGGYADTDLLLYRAEGPEGLVARQRQGWDPVLDWIENRFSVRLALAAGVMPVAQDAALLARLTSVMDEMTAFQLTGFYDMVTLTGSFSLALAGSEELETPDFLWSLSRIDEDWQIEQWGEDEEASQSAELKKTSFLHATDFFRAAR